MIMAVAWAKEYELVSKGTVWYNERWERGTVMENDMGKLVWDFEFRGQREEENLDMRYGLSSAKKHSG